MLAIFEKKSEIVSWLGFSTTPPSFDTSVISLRERMSSSLKEVNVHYKITARPYYKQDVYFNAPQQVLDPLLAVAANRICEAHNPGNVILVVLSLKDLNDALLQRLSKD